MEIKNKDLSVNTISFEYLVKHLKLDKIINNLGKPLEGQRNRKSNSKEESLNEEFCSLSVGQQKESVNTNNNMEIINNIENELNFEDMHKINLNNSKDFEEKLKEIRDN